MPFCAEYAADMTDNARNIVVLQEREVTGQRSFDRNPVDGDQTRTVEHDCAFDGG